MANPLDPPIGTSIFEYPPFFPNGQVNDAWVAYFQSLNSAITGGPVLSFNGRTGAIVPLAGDYAFSMVTGAAPLAGPVFTATPLAPTASNQGDSSNVIATTAFVQGQKQEFPTTITNSLVQSSDLSNAAWSKLSSGTGSAPTVTAAFATAPDGTTTAARLQCSQGSGFSGTDYSMVASSSVSVTIGDVLRDAIWLKSNTGSPQTVYFALSGSTHQQNVVLAGTGWTRYVIPWQVAAAGSVTIQLGLRGAGNLNYYTPANSTLDILVWGPSMSKMTETASAVSMAAEGDSITIGNSITGCAWPNVIDFPPTSAVSNTAVAGSSTTDMRTRFDGYKGNGYTHFSVMGGVNDIRYGYNTLAGIQSNLSYMWDTAASLGMKVTCISCSPYKGNTLWTSAGQTELLALNTWIQQYAASKGYYFLDAYSILQDPANPGQLLPVYDIGDHIHPTAAFAAAIGYAQRVLIDGDRSVPYIPTTTTALTVTNYPGLPTPLPISLGGLGNTTGLAQTANAIASATTIVNTNSAAAPVAGQTLTATSTTTAGWRFTFTAIKTANYTLLTTDNEIFADATSGAFTVTLPTASTCAGKIFTIVKTDTGPNAVTIGGTVSGVVNPTLTVQYACITVVSTGAAWIKTLNGANTIYTPQGVLDYTGASDSTTTLQALTNAAAQGSTFTASAGIPKFNFVNKGNGVVMRGPGMAQLTGGATAYWQPTTTSLPVVQISDDLANYNGSGVENSLIYTPSGTGQKGLVFAGGAAKCYAKNIMSLGFTTSCIEFRNDDVNPCTFNTVENVTANTNVLGARGIAFIDTHVAGTGWTTANQVTNFNATAPNGYPIYCESAQTNSLSNGYIQTSYSGHGLYFKKTATQVWTPRLNFSNVDVDNVSGYGGVSVVFDIDSGSNYRSASNVSNLTPIMGDLNSAGNAYWIAGHTTLAANFTVGATTVTLTSVTGLEAGMNIMIPGAGTAGRNYMDRIVSINTGTKVVTLDQHNSATQVNTGGDVSWGDFVNAINTRGVIGNFSNRAIVVGASNKIGVTGDGGGLIYQSNGNGQGYWSSGDYMTEWKDKQLRFLGSVSSPTVTAISRVGTTVTVTTSSAHKMGQGDPFTLSGIVDFDGFNSTTQWQPTVATVVDATHFTYTSLVSGSNTPANQAPTLTPYRGMHFNRGRLEFDNGTGSGIGFKIAAGTMGAAIFTDNINPTLNIWTPDTTNGTYDFRWGSSISTGKAMRIGNNSVGDRAYLTGNGAWWLLNAAAPATDAGGSFLYSATADGRMHVKDNAGNDGAILTTSNQQGTFTTAAPTGTASATAVMMGLGGSATITPKNSTRLFIMATFQAANSTINDGITCDLRFGTGAAPTNGTAVTGTLVGISQTRTSLVAADRGGMVLCGVATGLTLGTAYWLDVSALAVTGGTASITGVTVTAYEM